MRKLLAFFFALAVTVGVSASAEAASCFWVGGAGIWSTTNTASWASASGGTAGTCAATGGVPKQSADSATFDANSGGGVVTVDSTMSGTTIANLTAGAFTGTLNFATNNPSLTITTVANFSGTGTRTIQFGSASFTLLGTLSQNQFDFTTTTNATVSGAPNITFAPTSGCTAGGRSFSTGGLTYGAVTLGDCPAPGPSPVFISGNGFTFASLAYSTQLQVEFPSSIAGTITSAPTITASASAPSALLSTGNGAATLTIGSGTVNFNGVYLNRITFSGGTGNKATNSFNGGGVSGITVTPPSGGPRCIGC